MVDGADSAERWLASDGRWYPPEMLARRLDWPQPIVSPQGPSNASIGDSGPGAEEPGSGEDRQGAFAGVAKALFGPFCIVASAVIVVLTLAALLTSGGTPKPDAAIALADQTHAKSTTSVPPSKSTTTSTTVAPTTTSPTTTPTTSAVPPSSSSRGSSSAGSQAPRAVAPVATPATTATTTPAPPPTTTPTTTASPPQLAIQNPYPENNPGSYPGLFLPSVSFTDSNGEDWTVHSATLASGPGTLQYLSSFPTACHAQSDECVEFVPDTGISGKLPGPSCGPHRIPKGR